MPTTDTSINPNTQVKAADGKRLHHHVHSGEVDVNGKFTFKVSTSQLDTNAKFKDDLLLFSFPIQYLQNMNEVLKHFNLVEDYDYFIEECKEVIAVAENHQNDKGGGKMSFQSFFYNIPESITAVNPDAIMVLAINPMANPNTSKEPVNYYLAGYIHANIFEYVPGDTGKTEKGFYYNVLRVSDKKIEGKRVFRRMNVFTLMFTILFDLTKSHNVNFAYACMGKENVSIKRALHRNATEDGHHYERVPFTVFSKLNFLYGSKKYSKQLVEITHNEEMLKKMYAMVKAKMGTYMFFHYLSEEAFMDFIKKLVGYSKTSGVFMIPDKDGNIATATIAMNWGELFLFEIKNPKGIFKLVQASRVMDHFLRFLMSVGEPKEYRKLMKGLSYKYHKEHGVGVTFLATFKGDPYYDISKSLLSDEYINFIICNDEERLRKMKERSAGPDGNPRMFIDVPIT